MKDKLLFEQKKMKAFELRKQQQEQRKFAKQARGAPSRGRRRIARLTLGARAGAGQEAGGARAAKEGAAGCH